MFVPIAVTILIICAIVAAVSLFAWWKNNHGVAQRQLTNGDEEEGVHVVVTEGEEEEEEEVGAHRMEALLTEYAREILIDDYLASDRSYMTSLTTKITQDAVGKMTDEAAVGVLGETVNTLSARAAYVTKERTSPENILALLGVSEAMVEGYINDYVTKYHRTLDNMDVDSMAREAAVRVSQDFIKKHFEDKTAYVTAYILDDNGVDRRDQDQVTLVRSMYVGKFNPSKLSETHSLKNVISSSRDVLTLTEGADRGSIGVRLTPSPAPTKPITYGLFLSKDTAYAINENKWTREPSESNVIDTQLNFYGKRPRGSVEACVIVAE